MIPSLDPEVEKALQGKPVPLKKGRPLPLPNSKP